MARKVDLEAFGEVRSAGAVALDVRESAECRAACVPGAHLAPPSAPAATAP